MNDLAKGWLLLRDRVNRTYHIETVLQSPAMDWEPLVEAAAAARERAYAPYSNFPVGAAVLMEDGSIFSGANVENGIPALSICAERTALAAAASAGKRHPQALAVITETSPPARPCGVCRQALAELAQDLPILVLNPQGERAETSLAQLLPHPFRFRTRS